MSIRFLCPVCGYRVKAPDGTFGRRGHCPRCKVMIRVPKQSEMATPTSTEAGGLSSASSVNPEQDESDPSEVVG